jgi:hypothetical protein
MSIYRDKKDGVVTGGLRVEVQLAGLRKRAGSIELSVSPPRDHL